MIVSAEMRKLLKEAISDMRRRETASTPDRLCSGCGRVRHEPGYSAGCTPCWERNYKRRLRGRPDGYRFVPAFTVEGVGCGAWLYSDAWLNAAKDPVYNPERAAQELDDLRARRAARRTAERELAA